MIILYLFTFLVLAVIRIITGVSIKRVGYFSLKDVSFSPKPGVHVSIGSIGLKFHRPTVTRPGWSSLSIHGFEISGDPKVVFHPDHVKNTKTDKNSNESSTGSTGKDIPDDFKNPADIASLFPPKTRAFYIVRYILNTAKCMEIVLVNSSFSWKGICSLIVGTFVFRLDLRSESTIHNPKFVGTLDSYQTQEGEIPAHAKVQAGEVFLVTENGVKHQQRFIEWASLDVDGILGKEDLSVKELAFSLRLGKTVAHVDKIIPVISAIRDMRHEAMVELCTDGIDVDGGPIKLEKGSGPTRLHAGFFTDADKSTFSSLGKKLVRVVKQIDFRTESISIFGVPASKEEFLKNSGLDSDMGASFSAVIESSSLDLRRLNPANPGFKLNFAETDSAHQAVLCLTSLSLGMQVGELLHEVAFVPLCTLISKANVFSQLLKFVSEGDKREKNDSIIRAGVYVVSPNMNLDASNVPVLAKAITDIISSRRSAKEPRENQNDTVPNSGNAERGLFVEETLWPRAIIRLNVEEPAARIILPQVDGYSGMIISSASKISCDLDAAHTMQDDKASYQAELNIVASNFENCYRSGEGSRHDIFKSEAVIFKAKATTQPNLSVAINTKINNAHFLLTKDEVLNNLREVFKHFQKAKEIEVAARMKSVPKISRHRSKTKGSVLRDMPTWLSRFKLEILDITACIATENARAKDNMLRGLSLKIARTVLDYRSDITKVGGSSNAATKTVPFIEERSKSKPNPSSKPEPANKTASPYVSDTDGRRFAMALENLQGYRVEEPYGLQQTGEYRFIDIPALSLSSTSVTIQNVSSIQLNILLKKALISFDANVFFLLLLVSDILLTAVAADISPKEKETVHNDGSEVSATARDFFSVQVKTEMIRVKLFLPQSTDLMLECNNLAFTKRFGQHSAVRADNLRLYSGHPTVPFAWAIIVTLKGCVCEINDKNDDSRLTLNFKAMRLNAPYQFLFHRVFDNAINLAKSCINLAQQYRNHDWDLVIKPKEVKKYPRIPKIRIKTKCFLMTLEDDLFESELALIFQVGQQEQRLRLEKERLFERKAETIRENEKKKAQSNSSAHNSSGSSSTTTKNGKKHDDKCAITSGLKNLKMDRASTALNSVRSSSSNASLKSDVNERDPKHRHILPPLPNVPNVPKAANGFKEIVQHALHNHNNLRFPHHHTDSEYSLNSNYIPSNESSVTVEEARKKLLEHHATSWIHTINTARKNRRKNYTDGLASHWAEDVVWQDTLSNERIVDYSEDPALFSFSVRDLDLTISNPDMTDEEVRQYLNDIGKGQPIDTRYTIFIPLYFDWCMGEARVQLRDFPLPFIHFPPLSAEQIKSQPDGSKTMTSVRGKGNFVITEMYFDTESNVRHIKVPIVPYADMRPETKFAQKYIINVCRTVNSIKIFTDLNFDMYSADPTRVTYANSMQPTLQTAMMQFDSFSKPPLDVSPKLGFWDKMRAIFHSRFIFQWHNGDIFLLLPGSRSPYELLGRASGFVMGWRNQTRLSINEFDDPRRFFVVKSKDYVLAIPNYAAIAHDYLKGSQNMENNMFFKWDFEKMYQFSKVIMKFRGKVEWTLGLMFQMQKENSIERTMDFKPHYDIQLSLPEYVKDLKAYDAYKNFRSDYMHMAVSVKNTCGNSQEFNNAHLTPWVVLFFKQWWGLFDGSMSLPLRSGKLFAPDETLKPKFGRTLQTVQIQLELSPLFVSHTYRHPRSEELSKNNKEASTGIKAKLESFLMDLHQRREPGPGKENGTEDEPTSKKRWRMKMNLAEVNLKSADFRLILAEFKEHSPEELLARKLGLGGSPHSSISGDTSTNYGSADPDWSKPPPGRFIIPDNDMTWIDFDDFTEIDATLPTHSIPKITVMPLLYTPQFTYYRQTDRSGEEIGHDEYGKEYLKFGSLLVHHCRIGHGNPEQVQSQLLRSRIDEVEEQLKTDEVTLDALEEDLKRFPDEKTVEAKLKSIERHIEDLKHRRSVLFCILQQNKLWTEEDERLHPTETLDMLNMRKSRLAEVENNVDDTRSFVSISSQNSIQALNELADLTGASNEFANRFIVHNVQIRWNNSVRNALFRYMQRVSYRRQFAYFTTRRAVAYVEKLIKKRMAASNSDGHPDHGVSDEDGINRADGFGVEKCFTDSADTGNCPIMTENNGEFRMENFDELLRQVDGDDLVASDSYLVKLVSPQIQLVSEQNPDQCLLVTAHNIETKLISIIDKNLLSNDVSGTVETRYGVALNDAQFFVLDKEEVDKESVVLFSASNYGTDGLSVWPPWLSVELCFDSSPLKNALVVPATDVIFRYDKPNSLHMKKANSAVSSKATSGSTTPSNVATKGASVEPRESTDTNGSATTKVDDPDDTSDDPDPDFCSKMVRNEKYRTNRVTVDFPKVVATCDSQQYFAIYTIAVDLLMYSEPTSKEHNERIERVLLATDFGDLNKAVSRLIQLQADLHRIIELNRELDLSIGDSMHSEQLSRDKLLLQVEFRQIALELSIMFTAVKTGLLKGQRDETQFLKWALGADQIIWHLMDDKKTPLLDIGLADASFNRLQHGTDYNSNTIEVGMMQGFNLSSDAAYPEILAPYLDDEKEGSAVLDKSVKMVSIKWVMLGPIGGIPIMQLFETRLKPLKVQLERDTGEKIFEYLFPPKNEKDSKSNNDNHNYPGTNKYDASPRMSRDSDRLSSFSGKSDAASHTHSKLLDGIFNKKGTEKKVDRLESPFMISRFKRQDTKATQDSVEPDNSSEYSSVDSEFSRRSVETKSMISRDGSVAKSSVFHTSDGDASTSDFRRPVGDSKNTTNSSKKEDKSKKDKDQDELTLMVKRASTNMSIARMIIHGTKLCISYKGHGNRSITDIHEFVIQMPDLEYQNKTWSNLDLAMRLKKDVIKILLQHTGALIGNKITKRLKKSRHTQAPLRQIKDYVQFTSLNELTEGGVKKHNSVHSSEHNSDQVPALTITHPNGSQESVSSEDGSTDEETPKKYAPVMNGQKASSSSTSLKSDFLRRIPTVKSQHEQSLSHGSARDSGDAQAAKEHSETQKESKSTSSNGRDVRSESLVASPTSKQAKPIVTSSPATPSQNSVDGGSSRASSSSRLPRAKDSTIFTSSSSAASTPTKRAKSFLRRFKKDSKN